MAPRGREGDPVVVGPGEHDRGAERLELPLRLRGDGQVDRLLGVPAGPTAPGSSPPCPGSSTTWAPVIGVPRTVASPPHGCPRDEAAVGVGSEHREHHAAGGRDTAAAARPPAPATAVATVVVVLGAVVVVVVARRSWSVPWSRWSAGLVARVRQRPRADDQRRHGRHDEGDREQHAQPGPHEGHDAMRPRGSRPRAPADQRPLTTSTISVPASVGFWPTRTPAACSASCLAAAVPLPPDTMAPAWPIFLPGGAVTPAM